MKEKNTCCRIPLLYFAYNFNPALTPQNDS